MIVKQKKVTARFFVVEQGVSMVICAKIKGMRFYSRQDFDTEEEAERALSRLLSAERAESE